MKVKLSDKISMSEARLLLEVVTPLAKHLEFTKQEMVQIIMICDGCLDRAVKEIEEDEWGRQSTQKTQDGEND